MVGERYINKFHEGYEKVSMMGKNTGNRSQFFLILFFSEFSQKSIHVPMEVKDKEIATPKSRKWSGTPRNFQVSANAHTTRKFRYATLPTLEANCYIGDSRSRLGGIGTRKTTQVI